MFYNFTKKLVHIELTFSFSLLFFFSLSLDCPPGTFGTETKQSSCKECDSGQYRDGSQTDTKRCHPCLEGEYQDSGGTTYW